MEKKFMAIYCKLSTVLGEKRINRAELARMTKISPNTIHQMYYDRVRRLDYEVLNKICKALDCDLHDIIVYERDKD
jgi:putative transcriptional regulator